MVKPYPAGQLVKDWIAWAAWATTHRNLKEENPYGGAFLELGWLVEHEPETAWKVILRIFAAPGAEPYHGNLAAGPVEDLLSLHGAQFIERIEARAASSPLFASLLGGVWQFNMPNSIWHRVQSAAASSDTQHAG